MRYGIIKQYIGGMQEMRDKNEWIASLMRVYYNDMFNYGKTFTRDEDIIKDSIREVFISLWQGRHTQHQILSAKFYFLRAVKNKILKVLDSTGRRKNKITAIREYAFMCAFPAEKSIMTGGITAPNGYSLKSIVARLSETEKEVVYLKYYQLLDNAEIAEVMSITRQSVYNLLYSSIDKLGASWRNEFTVW